MVGNGSWSTVNDSTYTATITFQADLTGQGYLANQITDTFRLFTPIEQVYRVDSVWNATFSSASLRVVEWNGDHGAPIGQVMVYNPDGRETLPQAPFGSTGSTAAASTRRGTPATCRRAASASARRRPGAAAGSSATSSAARSSRGPGRRGIEGEPTN